MAEFLFASALNKTEDFRLASNVAGAGAFDDLVFRYRLREPDVWKTCFIQLKHKKNGGKIQRSSLTQISGDFSLYKYFKSYCEIKNKADKEFSVEQYGQFGEFEFVIYTNGNMESNSPLQGGDSDPLSILSSGTENGKYITFDETRDKEIFGFFEEFSGYHKHIGELESQLKSRNSADKAINETIKKFQNSVKNETMLRMLKGLKKKVNTDVETTFIDEMAQCDFTLYKEFLSKVKIFQSQSYEKSLKGLIEKELQGACKASPSVSNFIYMQFAEGFSKWMEKEGNVVWLNKNSQLWQEVHKQMTSKINGISKPEFQETDTYGIRFNQHHLQKLSNAIKQNTVLNIVTNSNIRTLQILKTYQALDNLGYKNSLFIGTKSLMCPCKWSDVLVVDCGSDGNVAHRVMDILQKCADCKKGINRVENLVDDLQIYRKKLILISSQQMTPVSQEMLRNISYFEDNFDISDLDEKSQKLILERPVNFQGTIIPLSTLVGSDPPESIKALVDSDVISILLSDEHELSVGRLLGDHPKYYVPRVLQHQVYLMEDILKVAGEAITFAVSGLQAEELKKYMPADEKICEFVYDESERNHNFMIDFVFSKTVLRPELENTNAYNEAGQNVKPEEVRYIILGNKNPESEFRELKKLCRNVHWIHVEEGSFLWRDTNGTVDIIRGYIDNTKHQKYDKKSVVEHNDRTMLLVADPGMGKSTFLSNMAYEIKKWNTSVWVLKINLNEHTKELDDIEFEQDCIDKCKTFLWSAAHSSEQDALNVTKEIFPQALDQTGKMVIIFDGFDEINPDYNPKGEALIKAIRDATASKIWISSRYSYREELENIVRNFAFTLPPFTPENQIKFLEKYWSEVTGISNKVNLQLFAKQLRSLCSQNFSDHDGEFTGIPLQTMMLGEAFVNEAKGYCCSEKFKLPEKLNLLSLFKKFTEKKFDIYFRDKNKMDSSTQEVKMEKQIFFEIHVTSALLSLFSPNEVNGLLGTNKSRNLIETMWVSYERKVQMVGIITDTTDRKTHFIHRCFAEYFAAKWFTDNFEQCEEFISDILFKSMYKVTRNIFDRMLAEGSEIHEFVLNNDTQALEEHLTKKKYINILDKGGRSALHLAASYNSTCIQQLVSIPRIDVNKPDEVLKWTPLRYADRTKSWMAMDILLQIGANPDGIVFTRQQAKTQEWGQAALWECASKGHINLLEFMLNSGIEVNASVEVPDNIHEKRTLVHRAISCGQVEVVKFLVKRGADINL